jgi:hypothetical protein
MCRPLRCADRGRPLRRVGPEPIGWRREVRDLAHARAPVDALAATEFVLAHEQALLHFFEHEVAGTSTGSRDPIIAFLERHDPDGC